MAETGSKIGGRISGGSGLAIATPATRSAEGIPHAADAGLSYAPDTGSNSVFGIGYLKADSTQNIVGQQLSASELNIISETTWMAFAEQGGKLQLFGDGVPFARARSYQKMGLGFTSAESSADDHTVATGGALVPQDDAKKDGLLYVQRESGVRAAFTPGGGPFSIGGYLGLKNATVFDETGSLWNNMSVQLVGGIELSLTEDNIAAPASDEQALAQVLTRALVIKPLEIFAAYQNYQVIGAPQKNVQEAEDYFGSPAGSNAANNKDPLYAADLSAILSFTGSNDTDLQNFLQNDELRWLVFGETLLGGAILFGLGAQDAGAPQLQSAADMLIYTPFDIDTPNKRSDFSILPKLDEKLANAALTRGGLRLLSFALGVGTDNPAFIAAASAELNPDPADAVQNNSTTSLGAAISVAGNSHADVRPMIEKSAKLGNLFFDQRLITPGLQPDNAADRVQPTLGNDPEDFSGFEQPSEVSFTGGGCLGGEIASGCVGLDLGQLFGSRAQGVIGPRLKLDAKLPLSKKVALAPAVALAQRWYVGGKGEDMKETQLTLSLGLNITD